MVCMVCSEQHQGSVMATLGWIGEVEGPGRMHASRLTILSLVNWTGHTDSSLLSQHWEGGKSPVIGGVVVSNLMD